MTRPIFLGALIFFGTPSFGASRPATSPSTPAHARAMKEVEKEFVKLAKRHLRRARWAMWWPWRNVQKAEAELAMAQGLAKLLPTDVVLKEIARVRARVERKIGKRPEPPKKTTLRGVE